MPIGPPELIMIFGAIILLFGASKLPELARSMGKSMGEFKKAQREVEEELRRLESGELEEEDKKDRIKEMAEELGVNTEGKNDDEILEEIKALTGPREKTNP